TNTYSGTTYVDGPFIPDGTLPPVAVTVTYTSSASVPRGAIVINPGVLVFNGAFTANTGPITLYQGSISGTGTLDASSYAIEAGNITVALAGNGPIAKTTDGAASVTSI